MYPRLAYRDERAALAYLTRVFGFRERREARIEQGVASTATCWPGSSSATGS